MRLSLAAPDEKRLIGTVAAVGSESLSLVEGGGRDTTAVPLRSARAARGWRWVF